ncbi:gustatory receptor 155 [Tribolium castaneum]|uniref:Gustatory receptor n=1 Tax=Tribolium castaneum TaxID=7070 RepID=D6WQN6_TRICA|nr:gustatory receptor 155 [Tribolium castaneum]
MLRLVMVVTIRFLYYFCFSVINFVIYFRICFLKCSKFLVCHHTLTIRRTSFLEIKGNIITGTADTVYSYGISLVIALIYCCNYCKRNCIIKALNKLHSVDLSLEKFGYTLPLVSVILMFVEYCNCNLYISPVLKSYTVFCNSVCGVEIILIMVEEYQFFMYLILLKQRFRAINTLLATNSEPINSHKIHTVLTTNCDKGMIVKLRSLHLQLCSAGKLLNEYFSIQILFLVALSFVGFTTNAYYSLDVIADNFANNERGVDIIPATLIWTVCRFIELVLISVICTATKNEVRATGELLYQVKDRFQSDIAVQLQLFGKQILHCDFKFTAFDFFDVDMTMFYGVIGSAATYLTILIQFEIAVKDYNKHSNTTSVP